MYIFAGYNSKVTYHIYSMNNCVTNKAKLPLDGAQFVPYGVIRYHVTLT